MPHPNWRISASILDQRRLGKQRLEGVQLFRALVRKINGEQGGWLNHPATLMWWNQGKPLLSALLEYTDCMIKEWKNRGYQNTMDLYLYRATADELYADGLASNAWPLFSSDLHTSHVCRLMQKDENYYRKMFAIMRVDIPEDWATRPYIWTPAVAVDRRPQWL